MFDTTDFKETIKVSKQELELLSEKLNSNLEAIFSDLDGLLKLCK